MILDEQVPTADPGELIIQYTKLIYFIALRYREALAQTAAVDMDDLLQAGRIALCKAQKHYDPAGGAMFKTYADLWIRSAMRRTIGIDNAGNLPEALVSLDEPLTEESDETRKDFIPDTAPTAEERIVEQDGHDETAEAVRAAVDRLKNAKQREVITRCWLNEQDKQTAADEMGIKLKALQMIDLEARHKLHRDKQLRLYAMPSFHVSRSRFNTTWTSATEAAVLWREEHLFGNTQSDAGL